MNRGELVTDVRDILSSAGFYVSELYSMRPIGFDLVARRDNLLLIIKVLTNIDALSEDVARELRVVANLLRASPILIGERSGNGFLQNDVVYDRFGIQTITPDTLCSHLLDGIQLKIYAGPGGFYVPIDSKELARLRREHNLSLGEFARYLNVSRRTIRLYEQGMNARIDVALRIEELLGPTITESIDIIQYTKEEHNNNCFLFKAASVLDFQREIFSFLEHLGYRVFPTERCPFEAISTENEKILLTCVHRYNDKILKKAQIVTSISKITEKHAVFFTDKAEHRNNIEGTPLIARSELKKIRDTDDILNLVLERIS